MHVFFITQLLLGIAIDVGSRKEFVYQDPVCNNSASLEALIDCIVGAMPAQDSEGFSVPSREAQADWEDVVYSMLRETCETIVLPASLQPHYTIKRFIYPGNLQAYCVLYESVDADSDGQADKGWGTVIVNEDPIRNLDIAIPHPLNDAVTPAQGIALFKSSEARTFTMTGAHRKANAQVSSCQSAHNIADAAHNVNVFFHRTTEVLQTFYRDLDQPFFTVQFHGMAASSCDGVDVYITNGSSMRVPAPGDTIYELKENLLAQQSDWVVTVPGDIPACPLTGTTNVQGRLLNGVAPSNVCTEAALADNVSGEFIHIEQKFAHRSAEDWRVAIDDTFPTISGVNAGENISFEGNGLSMSTPYPNPFAREATVLIGAQRPQRVRADLIDLLGRTVKVVYEGSLVGRQTIILNRENLAGGVYILRLIGEESMLQRIVVVVFKK